MQRKQVDQKLQSNVLKLTDFGQPAVDIDIN